MIFWEQKMDKKEKTKSLIFALIFSLIVAFTLFVYEPVVMYAGNIDEFWFDSGVLMQNMLLPFLVAFFGLAAIYVVLFLASCRKKTFFYVSEIISFAGFIYLYIHGNFLTSMLPTLYGDKIDWSSFVFGHIMSIVLLVVLVGILIFGIKKIRLRKTVEYTFYVVLGFTAMMVVSFVTTLLTPDLFVNKEVQPVVTAKNIRKLSVDKNLYIFLVDCTDSVAFNEYVQKKYKEDFKDFTYFENSAPGYSLTRDSIPLILTGRWNRNENQFNKFSTEAFDNSELFAHLQEEGYEMNLFSDSVLWNSRKALSVSNMNSESKTWSRKEFIKQEMKYIMYKYLPFPLKAFSKIESMDFNLALRYDDSDELYDWKNLYYYDNVIKKDVEKTDKKLFHFVHVEGAHSPYDMDEEMNLVENGTYNQKIGAAAKIADLAIGRIKEAGVFDNSAVVIMADHGWLTRDPVLYIKGFNEKNENMAVSSKQISWGDLSSAFMRLVDGSFAEDAFRDVPSGNRERYFYVNPYYDKEPMTEWKIEGGESYDSNNWIKTGIEYPYPTT